MDKNKILKFYAVPGRMYPHIEALNQRPPQRKFVGYDLVPVQIEGEQRIGVQIKTGPDSVVFHQDYLLAVRQGDLIPADQETAEICGTIFFSCSASSPERSSTD